MTDIHGKFYDDVLLPGVINLAEPSDENLRYIAHTILLHLGDGLPGEFKDSDKGQAINEWNTRPIEDALHAQVRYWIVKHDNLLKELVELRTRLAKIAELAQEVEP